MDIKRASERASERVYCGGDVCVRIMGAPTDTCSRGGVCVPRWVCLRHGTSCVRVGLIFARNATLKRLSELAWMMRE